MAKPEPYVPSPAQEEYARALQECHETMSLPGADPRRVAALRHLDESGNALDQWVSDTFPSGTGAEEQTPVLEDEPEEF